MSLILRKINAFAKKVANLPPKPGGTMPVADLQAQFDAAPEELKAALNGAIDDIIADYATKAELSGIQLGQISDGTVTPAKLSFDPATQAELNTHTGATTGVHGATSAATANTLAFRDANGRLQVATPTVPADATTKGYVDGEFSRMRTGSYTGNSTINRTIALPYTPKLVLVLGKYSAADAAGSKKWVFLHDTGSMPAGDAGGLAEIKIVANGFIVGYTSGTNYQLNVTGETYLYFWWG